jgi:hypothetical protein
VQLASSMKEAPQIHRSPGVGIAIMLLICYAILASFLPSQSPAVPFSGFMPADLWVVSRDQIPAARTWVYSIFSAYVALGIIGLLCRSRLLCFAVPAMIVVSSLVAFIRFGIGMSAFSK